MQTTPFPFTLRRLALALIAGSIAVAGTTIVFADDDKNEKYTECMVKKITSELDDELDLSRKQERQIAAILTEQMEKQRQLLQPKNEQLHALWQEDNVTAEALLDAIRKHREQVKENAAMLREQRPEFYAQTLAAIHAVLTPAQREDAYVVLKHVQLLGNGHKRKWSSRSHKRHQGKWDDDCPFGDDDNDDDDN